MGHLLTNIVRGHSDSDRRTSQSHAPPPGGRPARRRVPRTTAPQDCNSGVNLNRPPDATPGDTRHEHAHRRYTERTPHHHAPTTKHHATTGFFGVFDGFDVCESLLAPDRNVCAPRR